MRASALLFALLLAGCDDGPYAAPPGEFTCGTTFCDISTQFCVVTTGDAGAERASCASLSQACGTAPACACVESQCPNGGSCTQNSGGSLMVTCH